MAIAKQRSFINKKRFSNFFLFLIVVLFIPITSSADPNNNPDAPWETLPKIKLNSSIRCFFGPEDTFNTDGFTFFLPQKGHVTLTIQGPQGNRFVYFMHVRERSGQWPESKMGNPSVWHGENLEPGLYHIRSYWEDLVRLGPIPHTVFTISLQFTPAQGGRSPGTPPPPAKQPPSSSPKYPTAGGPTIEPNVIVNGDFSRGLAGWQTGSYGYSNSPQPVGQVRPAVVEGCLRLGVHGGTQYAYQDYAVTDLNWEYRSRFKVIRWSTHSRGNLGGWAAVAITFMDRQGNGLGTSYFYANPIGDNKNVGGAYWVKMGAGEPTPTGWFKIGVNIGKIAQQHHRLNATQVTKVRLSAYVFGTHEDRINTEACFTLFTLRR